MFDAIAILFIGFSVFSSVLILVSHLRESSYKDSFMTQLMGIVLLMALVTIQMSHFAYLQFSLPVISQFYYLFCLFLVAPSFYLFSRYTLLAKNDFNLWDSLHLLPALSFFLLPEKLQFPLSFGIGGLYLLWLVRKIYLLRESRSHFKVELSVFSLIFLISLIVIAIGMGMLTISKLHLIQVYSILLGCIFFLVTLVLMLIPSFTENISDVARETYATTTLNNINIKAKIKHLEQLLEVSRVFADPKLSLSLLAIELSLSNHQLSELINTEYGKGFSRFIREYRIKESQEILIKKPNLSVITIGLDVGFSSQSNFYQAFKEITGSSPGKYRKIELSKNKNSEK